MLIQQCNKVPFYDSSKSSLFVVVCRDNNLAPQSFLIFSLVSWARFFSPFTQGLLKIWTMNYRFWLLEIELVLCWLKFNKCMSNIKVRGSGPQPRYTYIRKSFHKLKIRYWVIKDIRGYKSAYLDMINFECAVHFFKGRWFLLVLFLFPPTISTIFHFLDSISLATARTKHVFNIFFFKLRFGNTWSVSLPPRIYFQCLTRRKN